MSVVEQALTARLEGSTSVTALAGTRVYPVVLPQEPNLPALTYTLISSVREHAHTADPGTVHARIQVTAWGNTYASASGLSEGVRAATQRWGGTSTGVVVHDVFIENEYAFYDDETGSHAHTLDLMVHYEE